MSAQAYEDRLVAFLDILDFRGLVDGTVDKAGADVPDRIAAVEAAYDAIHRIGILTILTLQRG